MDGLRCYVKRSIRRLFSRKCRYSAETAGMHLELRGRGGARGGVPAPEGEVSDDAL